MGMKKPDRMIVLMWNHQPTPNRRMVLTRPPGFVRFASR